MGGYFSSLKAGARRVADEIEYDPHDPERAVQSVIDYPGLDGFQWKVWWVAASGFFTTSYSIFAANVISPSLSYVYPGCDLGRRSISLIINVTTLTGTMIGMLLFGHLADRYGRKAVYGLELAIVVIATVGMTTASSGHLGSMNVYGWIGFWRTILGIGLGAEYPLSAIIAAEWSSTKSRGKMIAAVFLMQSVGQLAAYAFGLAILHGVGNNFNLSPEETDWNVASKAIDVVWRTTIGIGAFPALIALFLRRIIPETPHYLAEKGKIADAVEAVGLVYPLDATLQPADETVIIAPQRSLEEPVTDVKSRPKRKLSSVVEYLRGAKEHLAEKGRWRALLGVMVTWFLLDLAYYGLGLDNPRTISTIFLSSTPPAEGATPDPHTCDGTAVWLADPARPNITIYDMLTQDSIRDMMTISSGALPGSIIILFAIDYLPRTTWMGWMFVVLAGLFAINGGTYFVTYESDQHALTVTLYVLAQAIFNLGPNTMTFMLPAELFATKYRGTFYGLAAASGKLGAIMSLIITIYANPTADSGKFAGLLLGFCPAMLLGAFITWVWIPEVQYPRGHDDKPERNDNASDNGFDGQRTTFRQKLVLPNRPLADIAKDSGDGQILGMRKNLARLFRARDTHHPYESRRRRSISTIHRDTSMDQSAMSQRGIVEEADIGDGPEMRYVYTRYS